MSRAVSAPTEEHVRRLGAMVVLLCATSATLVLAPGGTAAAERHAGTVVTVDPKAETLVIAELVANGEPRVFAFDWARKHASRFRSETTRQRTPNTCSATRR